MLAIGRFATRVVLAFVSLVASRSLLELAHLFGWYPEQQLATVMRGILTTESAFWAIVALSTVAIWVAMDFVFYRRGKALPLEQPATNWQEELVDQALKSIPQTAFEWLRTANMGDRPRNEEIAKSLNGAGLIDRDFVGWTGVRPELRDAVAKRLKEQSSGWDWYKYFRARWQHRPGATKTRSEIKGAIEWKLDHLLQNINISSGRIYVTQIAINGKNVGDHAIELKKGRVASSIDNQTFDLMIGTTSGFVPVSEANPIPPEAEFQLLTDFGRQGGLEKRMTEDDFLKQWAVFRFEIEYDNTYYSRPIDAKTVESALSAARSHVRESKAIPTPKVTRRQ